ncbi:MAG: hypothetical protein LBU82_01935 [Treponema sp.]|jgi:hypothetical protein|nr:hypothetical protein [Treponema sp.]
MKNKIFLIALFSLVLLPPARLTAQSSTTTTTTAVYDTSKFPQWAKDMRRWDIIAFGSFPFAMFTSTFFMDTYRWSQVGFSDNRYAPWPMKSAGAVDMTKAEYEKTMLIAVGISAAIAFTDLIIVHIKRHKERRRIESMPEGSAIIIRTPYPEQKPEEEGEQPLPE